METLELAVKEAAVVSEDVLAITLVDPEGRDLPPWAPGAHLDVKLPSGVVRSYSLCGEPSDRSYYRIAVLEVHNGRGGSKELHALTAAVHSGPCSLQVTPPRNNFDLVAAGAYVFVAGGIGITPILPMVREAAERRIPWTLHYGGRTRSTMAFIDELASIPAGRLDLRPQDTAGVIPVDEIFADLPADAAVYVCGPSGLLDACQTHALAAGAADRLHLERFVPTRDASADVDSAFEVELRRTGTTLQIGADESILAKVLEVRPGQPWSCQEGICGSCETTVLAGEVDHRDEILDEDERAENDTMFICVSRCRGERLVLDL